MYQNKQNKIVNVYSLFLHELNTRIFDALKKVLYFKVCTKLLMFEPKLFYDIKYHVYLNILITFPG
jgi:hypothetical protein